MAFADTLEQIKNFDVNDIDIDRIGVWPLPGKIFVCALVVAAILGGVSYFKIKELNQQLDRITAQETTLRRNFETKSFQAANLDDYILQMEEMERSFGALLDRLPSDTEVPGLLEDIDARGSESGLDINSIRLETEQQSEYYVELPISINVTGSYHDMGNFVSGVAGMPRIVTLHNFAITRRGSGGELTMQIQAKTYRYKSQDE
ncbi:type 4a pilus biogenesis protein PilO [Marinimicrobium sp. ABcell2]|uniref:type 4a pilus biogenesis protein PilO n=1 Tax=Marinimicrobium sp. ABcell2 TaxID=3069751 RepID=UPI0027B79032|nr:type 4a pilus biogenesis protein PilO [Marinimicrobium sp. ABcell2]MDQ2076514.1 type 4a pilus biogenesis protein PilO [Marinimicrobium sp. ABcell2]